MAHTVLKLVRFFRLDVTKTLKKRKKNSPISACWLMVLLFFLLFSPSSLFVSAFCLLVLIRRVESRGFHSQHARKPVEREREKKTGKELMSVCGVVAVEISMAYGLHIKHTDGQHVGGGRCE